MEQFPGGDPVFIREILAWCRRPEYACQLFDKMHKRHGGYDAIRVLHMQIKFITNYQGHALICRFNVLWSISSNAQRRDQLHIGHTNVGNFLL